MKSIDTMPFSQKCEEIYEVFLITKVVLPEYLHLSQTRGVLNASAVCTAQFATQIELQMFNLTDAITENSSQTWQDTLQGIGNDFLCNSAIRCLK